MSRGERSLHFQLSKARQTHRQVVEESQKLQQELPQFKSTAALSVCGLAKSSDEHHRPAVNDSWYMWWPNVGERDSCYACMLLVPVAWVVVVTRVSRVVLVSFISTHHCGSDARVTGAQLISWRFWKLCADW